MKIDNINIKIEKEKIFEVIVDTIHNNEKNNPEEENTIDLTTKKGKKAKSKTPFKIRIKTKYKKIINTKLKSREYKSKATSKKIMVTNVEEAPIHNPSLDIKNILNHEKTDNEDINSSKRKNRNKKREIIEESLDDKNKIKVNEIINEIKLEKSRNENDKEKEINNLNNSLKSNSKEEISNQNNEPENIIKSIKIIKEVKSKEKGDFTYRTMENDVYHNYMNASDIKSKSNIYNELNWTTIYILIVCFFNIFIFFYLFIC